MSHVPGSVGATPDGVKVSGVIHWVSATESIPAEVRLYDRLFTVPRPDEDGEFVAAPQPRFARVDPGARLEPSLAGAEPGSRWQLERVGYFVVDTVDSRPGAPVLNRIVTLRDSWAGRAGAGRGSGRRRREAQSQRAAKAKHPSAEEEPDRVPGRGPPAATPVLAERFAAWPSAYGLSRVRRRSADR